MGAIRYVLRTCEVWDYCDYLQPRVILLSSQMPPSTLADTQFKLSEEYEIYCGTTREDTQPLRPANRLNLGKYQKHGKSDVG